MSVAESHGFTSVYAATVVCSIIGSAPPARSAELLRRVSGPRAPAAAAASSPPPPPGGAPWMGVSLALFQEHPDGLSAGLGRTVAQEEPGRLAACSLSPSGLAELQVQAWAMDMLLPRWAGPPDLGTAPESRLRPLALPHPGCHAAGSGFTLRTPASPGP